MLNEDNSRRSDECHRRRVEARTHERDRDEAIAAIREGLADAEAGRVKPARKALNALARKYGVSTLEE